MFKTAIIYCILLCMVNYSIGLSIRDFYEPINEDSNNLPKGDEEYAFVKLSTPIRLFSATYDHIYVNTNGILTFHREFNNFMNIPFPIEYPSISPFYSNIDTTDSDDSTSISYYETLNLDVLQNATQLIRNGFSDASDFEAQSMVVVTYTNVGHYDRNNKQKNTFQVAIICSEEETYVQMLYPQTGLNWIQADIGESGLPDVRSQAGFISEDGRHYNLPGSATNNVKYLSELSNYGVPGLWLFRIGPVGYEDNVMEPDIVEHSESIPTSCSDGGKRKCHPDAKCVDNRSGFCCNCNDNFYGNGFSCVNIDIPMRVSGDVTGSIGRDIVQGQIQSYVILQDGRSYTAITNISENLGYKTQLILTLGESVGWLFAKPIGNSPNGYQLTGGKLNQTSTLRFSTGEVFNIQQQFLGLNFYDQLTLNILIDGDLPTIPDGAKVHVNDVVHQNRFDSLTTVYRKSSRTYEIEGRDPLIVNVEDQITYETCQSENNVLNRLPEVTEKITRIQSNYDPRERALRISMFNKIGEDLSKFNPCSTANNCGANAVCVVEEDDTHSCQCKNGFVAATTTDDGLEYCVDIDECYGENICDSNAECINQPGGYDCRCSYGYEGNGYTCSLIKSYELPIEPYDTSSRINTVEETEPYQHTSEDPILENSNEEINTDNENCEHCSYYADCIEGICECRNGWTGDGYNCDYNCENDFVWDGYKCTLDTETDEDEIITPFCSLQTGCYCSDGYELFQENSNTLCRRIQHTKSGEQNVPCNQEYNCGNDASCEWVDSQFMCTCIAGFEGDGYTCVEKEISCTNDDICDPNASCEYDFGLGKQVCKCNDKYVGDGRHCQLAPECATDSNCALNSICYNQVCVCRDGFERDINDLCVPTGSCGGAICAENSICKWDEGQSVLYCHCPEGFEGDGVTLCKSIPPQCNVRNNCGLYATCQQNYNNPNKFECICQLGYHGDGFVCAPEENCANTPSLCHPNAECKSRGSTLLCVCREGYLGNGTHCSEVPRLDAGFLLISQGVAIVKVPYDGKKKGSPVAMAQMAIGIDKDCATGRFYWSDITSKSIWSAKYDGTDKQPFLTEDLLSPEGIAIDWISRRIYWTDSTKDTIEVADLDNSTRRAIIVHKHLINPRGIAVDPNNNKIYWSDWNRADPKIEWANLDGTEREKLVGQPQVQLPNSLAVKHETGELCFADAGNKVIGCINTHAKEVTIMASNLTYPFGLAVTEDSFYWTDWQTKHVESVDIYGVRKIGLPGPLFGHHKMYGMTATTEKCTIFYTACSQNGECPSDRLCLNNYKAPSGRSCKCISTSKNCGSSDLFDVDF